MFNFPSRRSCDDRVIAPAADCFFERFQKGHKQNSPAKLFQPRPYQITHFGTKDYQLLFATYICNRTNFILFANAVLRAQRKQTGKQIAPHSSQTSFSTALLKMAKSNQPAILFSRAHCVYLSFLIGSHFVLRIWQFMSGRIYKRISDIII